MKALLLSLLLAAPAAAQVSEEILRDTAGPYIVLPADGRPGCRITLLMTQAIGGRGVAVAPGCGGRVPRLGDAAAWYLLDGVTLIDPLRRKLMHFEEDERALPMSPSVADPRDYLVPAAAGLTRAPTAANSAGRWTLSRGKLSCAVTLVPDRRVAMAGCGALRLPARLFSWRIEDLNLLIEGGEDGIVFAQASDDRFGEIDGKLRLVRSR